MQLLYGVGFGHNCVVILNKEEEIKQGATTTSTIGAAGCQMLGINTLSSLFSQMIFHLPSGAVKTGAQLSNLGFNVVGLTTCPVAAVVKSGNYETGATHLKATVAPYSSKLESLVPEKLSEQSTHFFQYIANHAGKVTKVAIGVSALALPFFGMPLMGAGIGLPLAFHALEKMECVPTRLSLFLEKRMPAVSTAAMIMGGGVISQASATAALLVDVPWINQLLQEKVDTHLLSKTESDIRVSEIEAPWTIKNDLTFEQILQILDNNHTKYSIDFEINIPHCSKFSDTLSPLPTESDFSRFLDLFKTIPWKNLYPILKSSFKDDDRFFEKMHGEFQNISKEELQKDFEMYLEKMALHKGISKEDFLAQELQDQMTILIAYLTGVKKPTGNLADLEDAKEDCSKILAYLLGLNLKLHENQVILEDILKKLAVEGGDYCARGIKRTASELVEAIQSSVNDPILNYEHMIFRELQSLRKKILENIYQKIIETLVHATTGNRSDISLKTQTTDAQAVEIAQDVHAMDIYRTILAYGFYPLTPNERNQFGLTHLLSWSAYASIRKQCLFQEYFMSLPHVIAERGELFFSEYLVKKIHSLEQLTEEQKEILISKYVECNDGKWTYKETLEKFHGLFFVMQGILKETLSSNWHEVPKSKDDPDELEDWTVC